MSGVRGRVFKRGKTWHYEVSDGKKIVMRDNTGSFRPVLDACFADVRAVKRVLSSGHKFKRSCDEIVERACR